MAFNPDDGIFLGGGINVIKRRGIQEKPYAWKQTATLSVALATSPSSSNTMVISLVCSATIGTYKQIWP